MNRKGNLIFGLLVLVVGIVMMSVPLVMIFPLALETVPASILDRFPLAGGYEQELNVGEYITVLDEKSGEVVDKTSRVVYVGDEIISETNIHYRISKIRGNKAFARRVGRATDIVWKEEWDSAPVVTGPVQAATDKIQVAIYHTHSGESYVPTDGSPTIPARGGIFKVGEALAAKLRNMGVSVIDDKTPHEPQDANAYHRSRKTAVKLLKNRPIALLDVHRDGIPDPDFYNKQLEGEEITKVRLVVGRQNPNMANNLAFAKNIKAYMDKNKPGLIKGIFIGRGNYNQDLGPRALLLEVGTHTNDRFRAERGAALFAEALPAILNIQGGGAVGRPTPAAPAETGSGWRTVGWIIGIILIAGAAFLFISTGSIKGMKSKIGEIRKTEFANFFGLRKISRKLSGKKKE